MKIGVMVESFRVNPADFAEESDKPMQAFKKGLEKAAKLGMQGIQAYATYGALKLDEMNKAKAKEVLDAAKSNGLIFSAICWDFFGRGFEDENENAQKIEKMKRVLDFARELECGIVTSHIGLIPEKECEKKDKMRSTCREAAIYADSIGSALAVETGPEPAAILGDFLDSVGSMGIRVNFDPANLVMCSADNPVKGVEILKKYIIHTHAKDGVMIGDHEGYEELPLGKGGVDFDNYLLALDKIGYTGFLTIEREVGDDPETDIKLAKDFLAEKLAKLGLLS